MTLADWCVVQRNEEMNILNVHWYSTQLHLGIFDRVNITV